jgi:hypothetical protein
MCESYYTWWDHLCGLVIRVPGYRSKGPGFDSRNYKKKSSGSGPPFSLVSTPEEPLGSNSSGTGLESREYGRRNSSRWRRGTVYPQKLALTSLTSGDCSVGIVRLRTEATGFLFFIKIIDCQIFWQVVGLERSPLSLVSATEELLGRNSRSSGPESRDHGRGNPSRWPRDTLYPQKLALTLPTSGGRSVGIVR